MWLSHQSQMEKSIPNASSPEMSYVCSQPFMAVACKWKYLIHFEFLFHMMCGKIATLLFCMWICGSPSIIFFRSLSFLYWTVLHCSWKALKPICEDLSQGFYSVELVYVWPEASTTMSFWFLELCSKFWHWQVWFLQFCTCISSDNSHVEFLAVQIWHS